MKKGCIRCLLTAVMLLALLAGCAKKEAPADTAAPATAAPTTAAPAANAALAPQFSFSTTDIKGNAVNLSDFADAKCIMVNFWEPWCGPCVGEMPDLEKLYEAYEKDGLVILGIFSTTDMDDEAIDVLKSCGTTYPILRYTDEMEPFITDYVPTTIFLDPEGNILTEEPIIGANGYDAWQQLIEKYMNR